MTRRSVIWLVVAELFIFVNLGGAGIAAVAGEPLHAAIHAGLLVLGGYFVWRLAPKRHARGIWPLDGSVSPALSGELTDRLMHLEQSVDAIAIEIERIGEGQRFITRLFAENAASRAAGEGATASPPAPRAAPSS
jgi:hypothetical protein